MTWQIFIGDFPNYKLTYDSISNRLKVNGFRLTFENRGTYINSKNDPKLQG